MKKKKAAAPKIYVNEDVWEQTPKLLRDLPEGLYSMTKMSTKKDPVHGPSSIRVGYPHKGHLLIANRGGMPAISLGYPWGFISSGIVKATKLKNYIKITTENSFYKLEGPLKPIAIKKEAA